MRTFEEISQTSVCQYLVKHLLCAFSFCSNVEGLSWIWHSRIYLLWANQTVNKLKLRAYNSLSVYHNKKRQWGLSLVSIKLSWDIFALYCVSFVSWSVTLYRYSRCEAWKHDNFSSDENKQWALLAEWGWPFYLNLFFNLSNVTAFMSICSVPSQGRAVWY